VVFVLACASNAALPSLPPALPAAGSAILDTHAPIRLLIGQSALNTSLQDTALGRSSGWGWNFHNIQLTSDLGLYEICFGGLI